MGEGSLRHEDATSTSFKDASLDAVLSFDVLEHIPDYEMALLEAARILKPEGFLLWSAPFSILSDATIIRAYIDDSGELLHLLPAQYHGDPLKPDEGVLCYQEFGWDVLELMESVGFLRAEVRIYWNRENANVGPEQIFIVGRR